MPEAADGGHAGEGVGVPDLDPDVMVKGLKQDVDGQEARGRDDDHADRDGRVVQDRPDDQNEAMQP